VNGQQLSEKKKLIDKWKESLKKKLSDRGQLNLEIRMEEIDCNVMNKGKKAKRLIWK
jgi:hypothetical protein